MAAITGAVAATVGAGAAVKGVVDARKAQKESLAFQREAMEQGASGGIGGNPQTGQVDIQALDALTREMARKNAVESMQLEQELTPEVASLRQQSIQALQGDLGPDAYDQTLRASLLSDFQGTSPTARSQLSQDVYSRAAEDLALGSSIPQDVQNLITRRAAAQSGRVGGGLELGRDITARDLGLTSLDLRNNRLNVAQNVGAQDDAFRANEDARALQQRMQSAGLISSMGQADSTRRLAIAQLAQGIDRPVVGMDPGAAAALSVGNTGALQAYLANQQALQAQNKNASNQATGNLIGQLPGLISSVGGLFGNNNSTPYGTLPSFNSTLGSLPSYNTSFSSPSYIAPQPTTFTGSSLPSFNYVPSLNTTQGLYGTVATPTFTSPTQFPTGCWIARSAYGVCNPKWHEFRGWLLHEAPSIVRNNYIRFGERIGRWLDRHASFKPAVRFIMDAILENRKAIHA